MELDRNFLIYIILSVPSSSRISDNGSQLGYHFTTYNTQTLCMTKAVKHNRWKIMLFDQIIQGLTNTALRLRKFQYKYSFVLSTLLRKYQNHIFSMQFLNCRFIYPLHLLIDINEYTAFLNRLIRNINTIPDESEHFSHTHGTGKCQIKSQLQSLILANFCFKSRGGGARNLLMHLIMPDSLPNHAVIDRPVALAGNH